MTRTIPQEKSYLIRTINRLKINSFRVYAAFIEPRQNEEELHRKELICNTLLLFILLLTLVLSVLVIKSYFLIGPSNYAGIKPFIMLCVTGSVICLLYLSRKGHAALVSQIIIWILVVGCVYGQITWGADLPSVILLWCFIITASSILISTRYSLFLAITIGLGVILFQILEKEYILKPLKGWKSSTFQINDAIEYAIVFALIAGVSWLSNREILKSLLKVRVSKLELQKERDSLEIKVIERTHSLHKAQIDKINSMYQLVEFGRISSGLFHDLMTPINTLSLAVQQIVRVESHSIEKTQPHTGLQQIKEQTEICLRASNRIVEFMNLARRQIQHIDDVIKFEVNQEIKNSISLLKSKARQKGIRLAHTSQKKIHYIGSPTLFSHILINLISNAIDSYSNQINSEPVVLIYLRKKNGQIEIKIRDFGTGIPIEIQSKIFDPFFTTKLEQGCGIGLSATKHTLEKYFRGTISFISNPKGGACKNIPEQLGYKQNTPQSGTTFIIRIPLIKDGGIK